MKVRGKVQKINIEGGFWGVVGENGTKYQPHPSLDIRFAIEGKEIIFEAEPLSIMTTLMWGIPVKLKNIEEIY